MAFATKYRLSYTSFTGESHKLDIELDGYSGSVITVEGGSDPVRIRLDSSGDNIFAPIKPTSLEISLFSEYHGDFSEFYDIDDRTYRVSFYIGSTLTWQGFIQGGNFEELIEPGSYEIRLTAYDGLGHLKNIEFPNGGRVSIIYVIAACLLQTGLTLDIVEVIDIKNVDVETTKPLADTYVDTSIFNKNEFERWTYAQVLEELLKTFSASLRQQDGKWIIARHEAIYAGSVTGNKYSCTYELIGVYSGSQALALSKTISETIDANNVQLLTGGRMIKLPAYREAWIKQEYGKTEFAIIKDGQFNEAVETLIGDWWLTAWTGSGVLFMYRRDQGNENYYAFLAAPASTTTYIYQTTNVIDDTNAYIFSLKCAVYAWKSTRDTVKVEVINATGGSDYYLSINSDGEGEWTLTPTQIIITNVSSSPSQTVINWVEKSVRIPAGISEGTITVKLYAPKVLEYSVVQAWLFDDVTFVPETVSEEDKLVYLHGVNNENFGFVPDRIETIIGDVPDIANKTNFYTNWLGYSTNGAVPTEAWHYIGDSVNSYLINEIRLMSLLNAYSKPLFVKYMGLQGNIKPFTILIDHLGVKYLPVSYAGSYRENIWDIECIELVEPKSNVPAITQSPYWSDPENTSKQSQSVSRNTVTTIPAELHDKIMNSYRLGSESITGETEITFSIALTTDNYHVTVESYISGTTEIKSGYSIGTKTATGFTFTPPSKYPSGTLIYRATVFL